ncbi:zf-HC2 domain-containing protein [Actinoplanes sp. NPDC051859]|uniref:zf-HC2 domain-containing protein n=1 Tax=Actinoplanes sp. NPDC051859 TaxID=3363909 RepID=UPI003793BABE
MSTGHDELRRLLGGYLLGGLDDTDTDQLDAHLVDCADCRAELERLGSVPELLRSLPEAPQPVVAPGARPSSERVEGLLGRMRAERSRQRRRSGTRWLVAAAVVLLGGAAAGLVVQRTPPPAPQAAPSPSAARQVTAVFQPEAGSGLAGQAVLTGKTWGVSIDLQVSQLAGRGPFVCQVRKASGAVEQAATWGPTPSGNAKVTGASSIQLGEVSTVAVADERGHVLGTARLHP